MELRNLCYWQNQDVEIDQGIHRSVCDSDFPTIYANAFGQACGVYAIYFCGYVESCEANAEDASDEEAEEDEMAHCLVYAEEKVEKNQHGCFD